MNTATMDGSRALYALSEEKMTIKQLGTLNKHNVPGRAMTVDMLLNIFLLLYFQNIYFILAAGNLGYMLSHVLALSGILLLRRDRANWPRPIKLGKVWMSARGDLRRREHPVHRLRPLRAQVHGLRLRLPRPGVSGLPRRRRRRGSQPDGPRSGHRHRRPPRPGRRRHRLHLGPEAVGQAGAPQGPERRAAHRGSHRRRCGRGGRPRPLNDREQLTGGAGSPPLRRSRRRIATAPWRSRSPSSASAAR